MSKMADFVDEIEINKIRNTTAGDLSSVVDRREGGRPWVQGCDQITCANFNGVKIASHLCMCFVDVDFHLTM